MLAIVTGASRGIGRALAIRLAANGYTVAAIARSEEDLATIDRVHPYTLDLTDPAATDRVVQQILDEHGPCAVLVNNAGIGLRGAIEEIPMDRWRRQFELNLFACARLTQLVLPGMRAAGRGHIQNISSVAGVLATPFSGAYCATKFALEAMSDALRLEVAPFGIHVTLVQPGPVKTHFVEAAAQSSDGILDNPASPWVENYTALQAQLSSLHADAWTIEQAVDVCMAAIGSDRPRARYAAYSWTLALAIRLKGWAPGLFDRILARRMGL
jgi:short-subunit dehydrogenase